MDVKERFEAVVLGTAIGDALGYPVEFMGRDQIEAMGGVRGLVGEGLFSDDTQMLVAVAEGLIRAGSRASISSAAEEVAEEFIAWAESPENNRAPGAACMYGCGQLRKGVAWREAGKPESWGCGTAMRSMAYGLWKWNDTVTAGTWAAEHALMTHRSLIAQAAAAAVAAAVAEGIVTGSLDLAVEAAIVAAGRYDAGTAAMLVEARKLAADPTVHAREVLEKWRGWTGHEAAAASVFCALRMRQFQPAVLLAVNSPGDSDSLGAITGAIVAAVEGLDGIPATWIQKVEKSRALFGVADRLWAVATMDV